VTAQENNKKKLGIVTCYFNPRNYLTKFINFLDFYYKLRKSKNVDIIVVESCMSDSVYTLKNTIHNNLISLNTNSVYWQKEELINIGLRKHKDTGYKNLCWLDSDIEFLNDNWADVIIEDLNEYDIVQVFEYSHEIIDTKANTIKHNSYIKKIKEGNNHPFKRIGELGYGYAYKRTSLTDKLLYENAVVGGGDFLNILPFVNMNTTMNITEDRYFKNANIEMIDDYMDWYEDKSKLKTSYSKNEIKVAYHGDRKFRNYLKREQILKNLNFCPKTDLEKTNNNSLRLLKNKNVENYLKKYFKERNEDYFNDNLQSKRFFKKIINRVAYNLDVENIETEPMLRTVEKIKNHENKVQKNNNIDIKLNRVCVWSKNNIKEINVSSFDFMQNIIYDKSDRHQINSIKCNRSDRFPHTYLKFIISNYENLPSVVIFCNDYIEQSFILSTISILRNIPNDENLKFTQIIECKQPVRLDTSGHILGLYKKTSVKKSKHTFQEWNRYHCNKEKEGSDFYVYPIFYLGRNIIQNKKIEYYENLLSSISSDSLTEDELYLNRSWDNIFQ
jgi:hypothetical protein